MDDHQRRLWGRMQVCLDDYEVGRTGLDALAEAVLGLVTACESDRSPDREIVAHYAAELEREHDLRHSRWNAPGDVGPEEEAQLTDLLAEIRMWVNRRLGDEQPTARA